jgi:pyruvate-formate lyase-activating enzyme
MKGVDYKTLYWHADGDRVVCDLCPHGCRLKDGQSGICRSRVNVGGELVATAYGRLCSIANDPIEKKPLQRFHPGTRCLSVASTGCNLRCLNCQNWEISQMHPDEVERLEITNLVIPGWNDDLEMIRQMCQWLVANNMEEHPLHFTRFFPMYRLNDAKNTC